MLDNLVESKKNSAENRRLGRFLLTTFVLVFALALSGVLWSLFAKDFGIGGEDFELSKLVTPIPIVKEEPVPEPIQRPEKSQSSQSANEPTRQTNTLRIEESPMEIRNISVTSNTVKARPSGNFKITEGVENDHHFSREKETTDNPGSFANPSQTAQIEKPEIKLPKPPPIKKTEAEERKKPIIVSDGVVNGKATFLPKPPYPQPAKAVGANGAVSVQVTVDEEGNVTSAKAVSGHPLLKDAAERAARNAKFSPTFLSEQPVKVSGLIIYNFTKN